ncbi:MAG: alpha/beta hydrolase [Acidobacteria bacterium]|nr:alpha/beta hydrolase [Acidobacteriota bacterium]
MQIHFAAVIGLFIAAELSARAQPAQGYKPLGRLIDVNGRKLHIHCTGTGSPTVVLVAGGDAFSIDWALVQAAVAEKTRVCAYDRAGLAWSDAGPADETVEQTVNDLHALLRAAGEKGRFVLVGASIGGIFIRAYQHAFPDEVAALVFSNSSNRVGMMAPGGKGGLLWEIFEETVRSVFPLPASVKRAAPAKEGEPFDRLPPDLQRMRLSFNVRLWEKFDPAKAGPETMLSWRKEFLREFEETEDTRVYALGQLPVVVLSSGPAATESGRQSRGGAAARLDFLSSNSVHITAAGSGHEIHLHQPDRVVQALTQVVQAVRSQVPLNSR